MSQLEGLFCTLFSYFAFILEGYLFQGGGKTTLINLKRIKIRVPLEFSVETVTIDISREREEKKNKCFSSIWT